jgi:exo-beta-1,3-glucanase (GH17 family)
VSRGATNCRTAADIEDDFSALAGRYSMIRIYGTDCAQVAKVYAAAKKFNLRLFLGLFELGPLENQVSSIVDGVAGDWSIVDTVSVGNEMINNGQATIDQILTALDKVRSLLRAAGYQGPVVIVDTFRAVQNNPELCDRSDYCAFNAHSFFDGNAMPAQAGKWVLDTMTDVKSKLADPDKRIVITETGWPWQGTSNHQAVPSLENQRTALASIRAAFADKPHDVIFFAAFNELWKKPEQATFFAEQWWGIDGAYSHSDDRI